MIFLRKIRFPWCPPSWNSKSNFPLLNIHAHRKTKDETGQFRDIQVIGSVQVKHQELGQSNPSTRWGGSPNDKRNFIYKIFILTTSLQIFESFNENSNQSSLVKNKFLCFLYVIDLVSNPTHRRCGHAFYPIIPKFKMNASSLLKSHGRSTVCLCGARQMRQFRECDGIWPPSSQPIRCERDFNGQPMDSRFWDVVMCAHNIITNPAPVASIIKGKSCENILDRTSFPLKFMYITWMATLCGSPLLTSCIKHSVTSIPAIVWVIPC